ncbi:hypothetical protein BJY14_000297 [Actinomadura luteofluorescens]|uniref:Uncharacterized protein n=1 Tax=Actinomadura luteofluorescens TaxID=46163 RepID=A0A7Y9EAQ6_9ACTN|nr:hypothetical protein [Actinomadura luteofluorescens]
MARGRDGRFGRNPAARLACQWNTGFIAYTRFGLL